MTAARATRVARVTRSTVIVALATLVHIQILVFLDSSSTTSRDNNIFSSLSSLSSRIETGFKVLNAHMLLPLVLKSTNEFTHD